MGRLLPGTLLVVGLALVALYLFPLYWMVVTSLKTSAEVFAHPPRFVPSAASIDAYARVLADRPVGRYLWNSFVVAAGTTALTVITGVGAAYVLARRRNRLVDVALFAILTLQVLPQSLMVTPLFVGFNLLGLLDTPRLAVVVALTAKTMPFFVILCRASFQAVPRELEEAALIDGNSRLGAFSTIVLPLARNGILVAMILIFMQAFGEFVYSRSFIANEELLTATVGMNTLMGANTREWNQVMAYATIYVLPVLVVFVLLQRSIVSGLTAGALK